MQHTARRQGKRELHKPWMARALCGCSAIACSLFEAGLQLSIGVARRRACTLCIFERTGFRILDFETASTFLVYQRPQVGMTAK